VEGSFSFFFFSHWNRSIINGAAATRAVPDDVNQWKEGVGMEHWNYYTIVNYYWHLETNFAANCTSLDCPFGNHGQCDLNQILILIGCIRANASKERYE